MKKIFRSQELKFENDQQVLERCSDTNSEEYMIANEFCTENGKNCASPNTDNIIVFSQ